jgi:hypothetical protein
MVDPGEPFHLADVADTQPVRLPRRHRRGHRYAWWALGVAGALSLGGWVGWHLGGAMVMVAG